MGVGITWVLVSREVELNVSCTSCSSCMQLSSVLCAAAEGCHSTCKHQALDFSWHALQVSQTHRSTVQDQADAAKKHAEQLKLRCSKHQLTQQQLLHQLSDAEAGLRGSRDTNSKLLAVGKRLQSQVCCSLLSGMQVPCCCCLKHTCWM